MNLQKPTDKIICTECKMETKNEDDNVCLNCGSKETERIYVHMNLQNIIEELKVKNRKILKEVARIRCPDHDVGLYEGAGGVICCYGDGKGYEKSHVLYKTQKQALEGGTKQVCDRIISNLDTLTEQTAQAVIREIHEWIIAQGWDEKTENQTYHKCLNDLDKELKTLLTNTQEHE